VAGILSYCSHHPIEIGLRIPVAVIRSDLNREGLTSLVRDEMDENPQEWLHESLEDAVTAIDRKLAGE